VGYLHVLVKVTGSTSRSQGGGKGHRGGGKQAKQGVMHVSWTTEKESQRLPVWIIPWEGVSREDMFSNITIPFVRPPLTPILTLHSI